MSDKRRLFGWFGEYRTTRCQCATELTNEDGEREIPWADADDRAWWEGRVLELTVN
jgi:hypothetical protein